MVLSIKWCSVWKKNKVMASRILEAIWNQRNLAIAAKHFAGDYLGHSITEIHGPDGWKEWAAAIFNGFTNSMFTIQDQIAEGDKVVTHWIACGTHAGEFQGLPPTSKQVIITGIDIFRIANSKIIEGWMVVNTRSTDHEEIKF